MRIILKVLCRLYIVHVHVYLSGNTYSIHFSLQCMIVEQFSGFNPFTAMLATPSLWKLAIKMPDLKSLSPFSFFTIACERISLKMHRTESRFVVGPSNTLFAGMCVYTFQPGNFTYWGCEGVKKSVNGWIPLALAGVPTSRTCLPADEQVQGCHPFPADSTGPGTWQCWQADQPHRCHGCTFLQYIKRLGQESER